MSLFNTTICEENGQKLKAYIAKPKTGQQSPGLILMHEVYGVTKSLQEVANYFADNGFYVVCPNLYWREDENAAMKYKPSQDILDAMNDTDRADLMAELDQDREKARRMMFSIVGNDDPSKGLIVNDKTHLQNAQADLMDTIERAANHLRAQDQCSGLVAAAGFCFGARNAYLSLSENTSMDAAVAFYPTPRLHEVFDPAAASAINKPMMFVYGGQDPYISGQEKKSMRDASGTVIRYIPGEDSPHVEGTDINTNANPNLITLAYTANDHGFNRRGSDYSDPGASDHVLSAAVEFLQAALNAQHPRFEVPQTASTQMPQSPRYIPEYKV